MANAIVSCQIWCNMKLSKFVCIVKMPASIKRISKTIKKKWRHHFSIVSISGYFLDVQMQITRSIVDGPILPKFELFQNNLHVLVTYEFNMDRTNSNREKGGDIDFLTLKHS